MKLLSCVECGHSLSISAKNCIQCGSKKPFKGLSLEPEEHKGMSYKEKRLFQKAGGNLKISKAQKIILSACLIFVLYLIFSPSAPLTPAEQAAKTKLLEEGHATYACEHELEKRLYVPDSVEYSYGANDSIVVKQGNNQWLVVQKYKSKNRLGVMLRGQVECHVIRQNDNYLVTSILNK